MRSTLLLISALFAVTLVGCGSGGNDKTDEPIANAPTGGGQLKGDLEVVAFKGGYGIDFYQQAAKEFEAKNPDLKIKVTGDPKVWEQLRPRFIGGTPPDLTYPGWGMDHWSLAEEGELMDLDKALDSPAEDGKGTWRDTFEPSILALGKLEGKQYVLPYFFNINGWWYDPVVFAKNGWTAPKTYDELLALCEKIKAKGIAPLTFQGHYPYYMIEGMLLPWALSVGGPDVIKACQNLEPGAWKSPAILQAAKMIDELRKKGYFEEGAVGLTHTESQEDFIHGKAAMIPCGTWLYSEMSKQMPAGQKLEFFLAPAVAGGKGDPSSVMISIEPWMVPAKGKNPDAAVGFYKYMSSLEKAKQFVQQKGTLTAIKGSDATELPEVLKTPLAAFKASKNVWSQQYRNWYPKFDTETQNALTSMLTGDLTPEAFCDRVEAAAEQTRQDKGVTKHKL